MSYGVKPKRVIKDKAAHNARCRAWAAANPEASKAIKERWLKANREKRLKLSLESWRRNYNKNREAIYAGVKQRRARKKGAGGKVTPAEWSTLFDTYNNHCAYCLLPFTDDCPPTQDHMLPLIRGGQHTVENLVPACRSCNSRKQRRTLAEYVLAAA